MEGIDKIVKITRNNLFNPFLKYTLLTGPISRALHSNTKNIEKTLSKLLYNEGLTFDYEWTKERFCISYTGDKFTLNDLKRLRYRAHGIGKKTLVNAYKSGVVGYWYNNNKNIYEISYILSYSKQFWERGRVVRGVPITEAQNFTIEIASQISDSYLTEPWFYVLYEIIHNALNYNNIKIKKIGLASYIIRVHRAAFYKG